jgi:L-cysteine S-thiosulfotransferase
MVREHHHRNVRLKALALCLLSLSGGATLAAGLPAIDKPLTDKPGDPANGLKVAIDTERGDCSICHVLPIPGAPPDAFGNIGPPLAGVASRLTVPELRQRIVNAKVISPETLMPAYFVTQGLTRVDPKYAGKPILTAQEVEDLVAYLATLK